MEEKKDDEDYVGGGSQSREKEPQEFSSALHNNAEAKEMNTAALSSSSDQLETSATPEQASACHGIRNNSSFFGWKFSLLFHFVLAGLFLGLCAIYSLQVIHDEYFVPIMERARRTDEDLQEEYTYYDRRCTAVDLTMRNPSQANALILEQHDLKQSTHTSNNTTRTRSGVDIVMQHGAVLFPSLLHPSTVQALRKFVVAKNKAVRGTDAEIPISEALGRISYGIEATEDERVVRALQEIHSHTALKQTLEDLLGPNPALTEITAITASFGCEDQVWHPDTKPDGNAVKWAQTYAHSYSLFIPLQDTTGEMGATDLCPGTHYCANDDLHEICEAHKIGLHQIASAGSKSKTQRHQRWRAGDAALLNQHVWHRGTAHTDPRAQARVMFIVSFISRPTDPRQLSRGTYFHMKWNMWGHTWQDLGDAVTSMAWPWNVLRCLHLWKPKDRSWGYDLVTATALRIANNQLGCEPEDLITFVHKLEELGLPRWLHGTINMETTQAWQIYFRTTLANVWAFLSKANMVALGAFVLLTLSTRVTSYSKVKRRSGDVVRLSFGGVILSHGLLLALTWYTIESIHSSPWGKGISSGATYRRPFLAQEQTWKDDPFITKGPTTYPNRYDVLVDTRYDSETLGSYSRWPDYHHGNQIFRNHISKYPNHIYRSYEEGLPRIFSEWMVNQTISAVVDNYGRFLQQDYRTGDWRLMSSSEIQSFVRLMLITEESKLTSFLKLQIDFMLGKYRYGILRGTVLSRHAQFNLDRIERLLFGEVQPYPSDDFSPKVPSFVRPLQNKLRCTFWTSSYQPLSQKNSKWHTFGQNIMNQDDFYFGQEVIVRTPSGGAVPAAVFNVRENDFVDVAYHGAPSYDLGAYGRGIGTTEIHVKPAPVEGNKVRADFQESGQWFGGTIARVHPSGDIDILFDDGDYESRVPKSRYSVAIY
jgi:hypothetical protein